MTPRWIPFLLLSQALLLPAPGAEIIVDGGSRIVILEGDPSAGENPSLKGSWEVKEATNLPPRYQELLVPLGECKPARTNTRPLLTSSGGGAVLLDRQSRQPLFCADVPMMFMGKNP